MSQSRFIPLGLPMPDDTTATLADLVDEAADLATIIQPNGNAAVVKRATLSGLTIPWRRLTPAECLARWAKRD